MNPLTFALKRPITVLAVIGAILVGSGLALTRMKIDIFPNLNLPVIYVVQPYGGMSPEQMEGLLTFPFENHFLYISGIHHIESRNIQGFSQMKLFFHPDTDMMQAMAETVAQVNRSRAFQPPGTVPPFVVRYDAGSAPVGYLVLESKTRSIGEIQDAAYIRVRPMAVSLPGVSAPPPFGGNQRTIVIHLDPARLRSYHLSPDEVIAALNAGNTVTPAGNARIKDQMPIVPSNAMVRDPQDLGDIPIRPGVTLHLRDVGWVEDSTDIPTSFALVNGRRAVYMLITKRADASTLSVVNAVKAKLPDMQAALPEDISLRWEFDQSPYVKRAMFGVASEGLLGAVLTGLMVLVFLRDWRSVVVVVLNIPFALLGAVVALWVTGQTINIMTLGGLALAVGILVDESTVEVENIHTQLARTPSVALAVCRGNAETAVPRLLAMLCILAVFIPAFFMQGAAGALFVPLSLAVGFSMITSYLLSSTFVPVLSVWLLRRHGHHVPLTPNPSPPSSGERGVTGSPLPPQGGEGLGVRGGRPRRFTLPRLQDAYAGLLRFLLRWRRLGLCAYVLVSIAVIGLIGPQLGQEIFPNVDSGQFQLRVRAPAGTRIEQTEEIGLQTLEIIKSLVGPENVEISVGFGGVSPSSYTINTVYVWTGGPEEVLLRVALKHGSGLRIDDLKHQLREVLPERLGAWLRNRLRTLGVPEDGIKERLDDLRFSFEPADIVNEVMSFGSPTPIAVSVDGPDIAASRRHAEKVREQLARIESLRDLQYVQTFNYPTVEVAVDRERAGKSKVTTDQVARAMVAYTSSSRFVMPNYWVDPKSGTGYQVQVEVPPVQMDSVKEVELVTVKQTQGGHISLRDVARVRESVAPGQVDRYNMRRTVTLTANIEGEDLGRVSRRIEAALKAAGEPPRGVRVSVRGQIVPMQQMFAGLASGLGLAVVAILILLTAYFQSFRLAAVVISTVPAVLAGVVLGLFATRTTVNIQSFMGAIMSIGVAVANAILLLTFAERSRQGGASSAEAALAGARGRLRPILMTSLAMISGMVPMALALGEGGEQTAPLGRAVIGGLLAATPATLFILPAVFAVVQARASTRSVSLHPRDPESPHFVAEEHSPLDPAPGGTA